MIVEFWGTRSGIAIATPSPTQYGGNTACLAVHASDETFLFDCGTGAVGCGTELNRRGIQRIGAFFSGHSWDRIQGLPFFSPLFRADFEMFFYALDSADSKLQDVLKTQMSYTFFPVNFDVFPAHTAICTFPTANSFAPKETPAPQIMELHPSPNVNVNILSLSPRSPHAAYRFQAEGHTLAYAVNIDWRSASDSTLGHLATFIDGADLLITNIPSKQSADDNGGDRAFLDLHRRAKIGQTVVSDYAPRLDDDNIAAFVQRVGIKLIDISPLSQPLQAASPNLRITL